MKKLIARCNTWGLASLTLFLLAFIPLYPKLPLLDIRNTWVYIRAEDFVVLFVLLAWIYTFIRNKLTLKTPLTIPILLFWLIGGVATLHSIVLIAPSVWEIFPNVAFLSYIRRIEYMSLFFVACSAVKNKQHLPALIITTVLTVFLVSVYGLGQKYAGFPAFLTMNEEFAKGIPITLSALSRMSSTFGGHYDLAAFLVLTIPIIASVIFGVRNWFLKIGMGFVALLATWVLFMTVSRISLFALLVSLGLVLFIQKRKLMLLLVPIALVGLVLLISFAPRVVDRFGSTVKEIDVLVDAKTGLPIGHIQMMPKKYFEDKVVRQLMYDNVEDVAAQASPSARFVIPYEQLSESNIFLTEPNAPTGEDLPSGTSYVNLSLSRDLRRLGEFLYEPKNKTATTSADVFVINGQYLLKRAYAYDLSFTTRFQGEWPKAITAFKRNILVGSGYGSVSLAVDNSYLRMLGEVGGLGFVLFISIFLAMGMYIRKTLVSIDSPLVKSFVWGYAAGVVGICINAVFIDVFEASKVAFVLWLLTGSVIGILSLYAKKGSENFYQDMKRIALSPMATIVYLFLLVFVLWSPLMKHYFIGDDYTWLRWAATTPDVQSIAQYFTQSDGFFYRPGTKLYFYIMYQTFWLNQSMYHFVSVFLHFLVSVCVFLLAHRLFRKRVLAALSAILFVVLTGFSESIFWISATGFLFTSLFVLMSLLFYGVWREKNKTVYLVLTFVCFVLSLLFHELGIVTPFLFLLYEWLILDGKISRVVPFLSPLPLYAVARFFSQSHWLSGDYNYNLLKFPFNAVGNIFGYVSMTILGTPALPMYQTLRSLMRDQPFFAIGCILIMLWLGSKSIRKIRSLLERNERRIVLFAILFVVVGLLPFLGLGNIASRYGYLASVGVIFLLVSIFEKLYAYVLPSGRDIARIIIAVLVGIFVLFHSVMITQLHKDWSEAGERARRFIVAIDSAYLDYWSTTPMEFHLVNVPIRHGEAWVFPVGISDALWFVFRNPNINVSMWPTTEEALLRITAGNNSQKVFVFDGEGKVTEVVKELPVTQ